MCHMSHQEWEESHVPTLSRTVSVVIAAVLLLEDLLSLVLTVDGHDGGELDSGLTEGLHHSC